MKLFTLVKFLAFLFLLPVLRSYAADKGVALPREISQGWDAVIERTAAGNIVYDLEQEGQSPNRFEHKWTNGHAFLTANANCLSPDPKLVGQLVWVVNPKYEFALLSSDFSDKWSVKNLVLGNGVQTLCSLHLSKPPPARAPIATDDHLISELLSKGWMQLKSCSPLADNPNKYRIELERSDDAPHDFKVSHCEAVLLADREFQLDTIKVEKKHESGSEVYQASFNYVGASSDLSWYDTSTEYIGADGSSLINQGIVRIIESRDAPRESEFRMSHFGLPEPAGLEESPTNWFILLGLAVGTLLLMAARRFKKTQKQPS